MEDITYMSKKIDKLYRELNDKYREIVIEKIKMSLEIAREDNKRIPRCLELYKEEVIMLEDILIDRAYDAGKDKDAFYKKSKDGYVLIKIEDILLYLRAQDSFYMTKQAFEEFYKETEEEGGSLDDFMYLNTPSLEEAEFFELFKSKEEREKHKSDNEAQASLKEEVNTNLPTKQKSKITFGSIKKAIVKAFNKGER